MAFIVQAVAIGDTQNHFEKFRRQFDGQYRTITTQASFFLLAELRLRSEYSENFMIRELPHAKNCYGRHTVNLDYIVNIFIV